MKRINPYILTFLVLVISSSCYFPANRSTLGYSCVSKMPEKSALTGTWVANEPFDDSGRMIRPRFPKLTFYEDGKLEVEDFPATMDVPGDNYYLSKWQGTWRLDQVNDNCVSLKLQSKNTVFVVSITEFRFSSENKYLITEVIGDPDSGNAVVFEKQE